MGISRQRRSLAKGEGCWECLISMERPSRWSIHHLVGGLGYMSQSRHVNRAGVSSPAGLKILRFLGFEHAPPHQSLVFLW